MPKSKDNQKSNDITHNESLPATFKIIAGSYEKLLYGLEGTILPDVDQEYKFDLKPIFIFPAHVSCIKAVAASPMGGKWLATGSADEIVKVWDLRRKKEIGGLMHHQGSITHLSFPSRSHLLSASEDGTLCLFRTRDWVVLRTLKGHKGRVNSVAVHPSGKVALSVGLDKTLRMWDLMRGKGSASTKLGKEGELVRWNISGSLFVLQSQSTIDIYSTQMQLLHNITHPSRLHDLKFCQRINGEGEVLLAAAEDKKVSIYDVGNGKSPRVVGEMVGHENRVKAIDILRVALPKNLNSKRTSTTIVCTISSDGKIFVYDLDASESGKEDVQIRPKVEYDTKGTRLTCVSVADGEVINANEEQVKGKRKRVQEKNKGGEEDEAKGEVNSDKRRKQGYECKEEVEEWAGVQDQEGEEQEAEQEEAEEEAEEDESN